MSNRRFSSRCLDAVGRAMQRLCGDQQGGMLVFVAFSFMVMVGTAALAVDISRLYMLQNKLQVTADAAALAGAGLLPDELEAHAAAMDFAQLNLSGANDGAVVTDADVEVGRWDKATRIFVVAGGQPANAVRVSARRSATNANPVSLYFARILGFETADLGVQSTAGRKGGPVCVIALDPTSTHAIRLDSNAIIDMEDCGIHVESNDSAAIETFSNSSVDAKSICVVGDYGGSNYTPTPETGCKPIGDPLAAMAPPPVGGCDFVDMAYDGNASYTLSPGVYCGGIAALSNVTLTFEPGIYVIKDGPFALDSNVSATGTGVGFYLTGTNATIDFDSNTQVSFSAPTTGPLAGVVFFEDREAPEGQIHHLDSNTNQQYEGTLYFSRGTLEFNSNTAAAASDVAFTAIIAYRMVFDSNASLRLNGNFDASQIPVQCQISGRCLGLLN